MSAAMDVPEPGRGTLSRGLPGLFFSTMPRPRRSTLFPYTTLFRSRPDADAAARGAARRDRHAACRRAHARGDRDRKSTRLNSSHVAHSYDVMCSQEKTHLQSNPTDGRGGTALAAVRARLRINGDAL